MRSFEVFAQPSLVKSVPFKRGSQSPVLVFGRDSKAIVLENELLEIGGQRDNGDCSLLGSGEATDAVSNCPLIDAEHITSLHQSIYIV